MNVSEIKLANFENMVINDAEQKRNAILKEITEEKQARLAEIENDLNEKAQQRFKRETAKISKEKNEHIVQKQLICKQLLLSERQKLIDGVFDGVINLLIEFTNSNEYEKYLLDTIVSAKQDLEYVSSVQISKKDEIYADKIEALGFAVEYTDEVIIGGCLIIDRINGVRIDGKVISKVEIAKDKFLETYNLKI